MAYQMVIGGRGAAGDAEAGSEESTLEVTK